MSLDTLLAASHLLLPEVLVRYFEMTKHEVKNEEIHFYFTELNEVPEKLKDATLHSKGFFTQATVQDFPIRGKSVYLHITRRRWLNKSTFKVVSRDWELVAMVKGTKAETVIEILHKIPFKQRKKVKEVTLDMAGNMGLIVKKAFVEATLVIDRFHVQKLALDALQEIRIKHRWDAIDANNDAIEKARSKSIKYSPELFSNGDTLKQLLARSRYLLYKNSSKWTLNQSKRAKILFERYPDLEKAYPIVLDPILYAFTKAYF